MSDLGPFGYKYWNHTSRLPEGLKWYHPLIWAAITAAIAIAVKCAV